MSRAAERGMSEVGAVLWTRMSRALVCLLVVSASACGTSNIPNTDVEDTAENREVLDLCEDYRRAVERRNVRDILALASTNYYEDSGTPGGDDDYDLAGLRRSLLRWRDSVTAVRYEVRYRRVQFESRRALVDYTYTASFRVRIPAILARPAITVEGDTDEGVGVEERPERWLRRVADNRLELERQGGHWRILSGM